MATTQRQRRFAGHTKHTFYCSCGRQVSGNGGKQHFKLEGHKRITWEAWKVASDGCRTCHRPWTECEC